MTDFGFAIYLTQQAARNEPAVMQNTHLNAGFRRHEELSLSPEGEGFQPSSRETLSTAYANNKLSMLISRNRSSEKL
jgi:hypothetical protein